MNRTGCVAKGTAYGRQIGQELLLLAQKAYAEGKISEADWQKLPDTPQVIVNLVLSTQAEKGILEALLESYQ